MNFRAPRIALVVLAFVVALAANAPLTSDATAATKSRIVRSLVRYGRIYVALWKNSIIREMGFKANFLLWILF